MTVQREALRQQMLLRALWRDSQDAPLHGWLQRPGDAGLAAYRGNAGAVAERALASAFPTVAALVGESSFGALARDFWRRHAPLRGDLAQWGAALPAFIADNPQLADEPYLADSARLDWLVHQASLAADAPATPPPLDRLGFDDAPTLHLQLAPGAALLESAWPVALIWQSHQSHAAASGDARFAPVREAFARGQRDRAFVIREGLAVHVHALEHATAAFTAALLSGQPLGAALDAAGADFAFDQWLARALGAHWLVAINPLEHP
jgi:hypothetical protein